MFNTSFEFQKVCSYRKDPLNPHIICKTLFRFDSYKKNRYIVEVVEHEFKLFVVKFYYVKDSKNSKKYNIITNKFEAPGVIRTVFDICFHVLKLEPNASFAFIGVPKLKELKDKNKIRNNQRFRVYKSLTGTVLGEETFHHVESADANAYLLVNNNNPDTRALADQMIQKLTDAYQNLGDLLG